MEFKPQIIINNKIYNHVDNQRGGISAIYRNDSNYLRIGEKEKIKKDIALHKKMESYNFPIPKILDEGISENLSYFIEESLGEEHFGNIFKRETEKFGIIQDKTFDQFIEILVQFAHAQLQTITSFQDWNFFTDGIHLDLLCNELPGQKEKILNAYKKVEERLSVFPFALLHGDLTPFNIFPKGVIDFEASFMGPVGYDLGAIVEHSNWFPEPKDFEYYRFYNFTDKQKKRLLDKFDSIYTNSGLPRLSDYLVDFNFTKGIWFAVRMDRAPKLQKYRYKLINQIIEEI